MHICLLDADGRAAIESAIQEAKAKKTDYLTTKQNVIPDILSDYLPPDFRLPEQTFSDVVSDYLLDLLLGPKARAKAAKKGAPLIHRALNHESAMKEAKTSKESVTKVESDSKTLGDLLKLFRSYRPKAKAASKGAALVSLVFQLIGRALNPKTALKVESKAATQGFIRDLLDVDLDTALYEILGSQAKAEVVPWNSRAHNQETAVKVESKAETQVSFRDMLNVVLDASLDEFLGSQVKAEVKSDAETSNFRVMLESLSDRRPGVKRPKQDRSFTTLLDLFYNRGLNPNTAVKEDKVSKESVTKVESDDETQNLNELLKLLKSGAKAAKKGASSAPLIDRALNHKTATKEDKTSKESEAKIESDNDLLKELEAALENLG